MNYKDGWLWIGETPVAAVLRQFDSVGHAIAAQAAVITELNKLPASDKQGIQLLQMMAAEVEAQLSNKPH